MERASAEEVRLCTEALLKHAYDVHFEGLSGSTTTYQHTTAFSSSGAPSARRLDELSPGLPGNTLAICASPSDARDSLTATATHTILIERDQIRVCCSDSPPAPRATECASCAELPAIPRAPDVSGLQQALGALLGYAHCFEPEWFGFGLHGIHVSQVFMSTPHSIAFVNIKPVVPGHVLVTSRRPVARQDLLTAAELTDMFSAVQRISRMFRALHPDQAMDFTIAIQDGPLAGQTVPHVHIHVLPRLPGDLARNDDVYDLIDAVEAAWAMREAAGVPGAAAGSSATSTRSGPFTVPSGTAAVAAAQSQLDPRAATVRVRALEEMAVEAAGYRDALERTG